MNSARNLPTATLLANGKVLIAGGFNFTGDLTSTDMYDPATNTFAPPTQTPSMNSGRELPTAMLLPNGKVLIVGGADDSGADLASVELYTP